MGERRRPLAAGGGAGGAGPGRRRGRPSPRTPARSQGEASPVDPVRGRRGRCRPSCRSTPTSATPCRRSIGDLRALPGIDGTTAYVTGPGAVFSDFAEGFSGIDGLLLLAAFGVVLLILLVVYRSPLLPLLVIGTAGMALVVSLAVAYFLAKQGWIAVNGQSQGIASILVVGAATDYGLLLVARYREELRQRGVEVHRDADGAPAVVGADRRLAAPR